MAAPGKKKKGMPAIVWLHPYSYSTGYTPAYGQSRVYEELTAAGFAVLAYDQLGFGLRLPQGGTTFYARYGGRSSIFGHMVKDARSAVDFLYCRSEQGAGNATCDGWATGGALKSIPTIDFDRVFVMGYSLGGNVALHAAALDSRVKGVASFAGFTPFRTDTADKPTGGLRRLAEMHALLPRLGQFIGNEEQVPYDYGELLEAIAPRPTLLYTPTEDRDATHADVAAAVKSAQAAWEEAGAGDQLTHSSPEQITQMGETEAAAAVAWAKKVAGV